MDILSRYKRFVRLKKLTGLRKLRDKCLSDEGMSNDLSKFSIVKSTGGMPFIWADYHGGCAKYYMQVSTKIGRIREYGYTKWECFDKIVLVLYKYESRKLMGK